MKKSYYVINSREEEPFSFKKVYQSAKRVGASESLARKIAENVQQTVYPGIKTSEIFNKVKNLLRKEDSKAAIKFSRCRDTELLGWRYPKNKGLEYFIESQNLYPITILPSLKYLLAEIFVSKKIMLVKDFLKLNIFKFSKENKIPLNYLEALAKEGKILLGIKI